MRTIVRAVSILLFVVVLVVAAAVAWAMTTANSRYNRSWDVHAATFPIPFPPSDSDLAAAGPGANVDSVALAAAVTRGAHLVHSRLNCEGCHGPDLGGNVIIDAPVLGYWAAPNLTLGEGSVTKSFTAHEWDMAVRHGVRHDGRSSSMPCGEFVNLSDHELSDVVAYIRSNPPVDRLISHPRFGPVFAFLIATQRDMLPAYAIDHALAHVAEPPAAGPTPEFGRHIAQVCTGCHGPHFSGGKLDGDPNMPIVANITPHETGLKAWTEADFVKAMRDGHRPDGTAIAEAMPWKSFSLMDDVELRAVWAYLRTLPPRPKGQH